MYLFSNKYLILILFVLLMTRVVFVRLINLKAASFPNFKMHQSIPGVLITHPSPLRGPTSWSNAPRCPEESRTKGGGGNLALTRPGLRVRRGIRWPSTRLPFEEFFKGRTLPLKVSLIYRCLKSFNSDGLKTRRSLGALKDRTFVGSGGILKSHFLFNSGKHILMLYTNTNQIILDVLLFSYRSTAYLIMV